MRSYCENDVSILKKASLTFRELMLDTTGIDPFCHVTIASVCMAVFKCCFYVETWSGVKSEEQQRVSLAPVRTFD